MQGREGQRMDPEAKAHATADRCGSSPAFPDTALPGPEDRLAGGGDGHSVTIDGNAEQIRRLKEDRN